MIGLAIALAVLAGPTGPGPRRFEAVETHMGSPFKVILYCPDPDLASRAQRAAFDRIAALDRALSDYDPESELMRLCDRAGGPPVKVGDDLFAALDRALAMAERSGGAFDPTIAPVGRLWRRARRQGRLPDADDLGRARALVGHRRVTLDREARTARLEAGVRLDLGGIAKGLAAEEAIRVLRGLGITRALVAGGGASVAGDPPPDAPGWTVGVADLDAPGANPLERSIVVANRAVSTSGDAERFVEIDGVRYSHIVDPKTGIGLTLRSSVTVVAPDGPTADSLATAASVLGPDRGLRFVREFGGAEALIVWRTSEGVRRVQTPGFDRLAAPARP